MKVFEMSVRVVTWGVNTAGSVPTRAPGDESNFSVPCINTARVFRILVYDATAVQPEDIPKLNIKRFPLLV